MGVDGEGFGNFLYVLIIFFCKLLLKKESLLVSKKDDGENVGA